MNYKRKMLGGLSKGDTTLLLPFFCNTVGRIFVELKQPSGSEEPKKSGLRDRAEV